MSWPAKVDGTGIDNKRSRHRVQQGGLAGTVGPDNDHKGFVHQPQVHALQGPHLIRRARVEGLANLSDFKHGKGLPSGI